MTQPVNIAGTLRTFHELWSPRIIARTNGYDVRVAKFHGEHVWHAHTDADELFLVVSGELTIQLREPGGDRAVVLGAGELFVVPQGVEHRPVTTAEAHILMLDPTGTATTGDAADVPSHIPTTTGEDRTPG